MNDIVERLRSNAALPICPFDRRSPEYFTTPNDKPCKFCGGEPEGPDKCTGADTSIMSEAASIIEALAEEAERLTAENNELRTGEYLVKVIEERERLRKALKALLDRDERNTCQHENTHRGGFLWEICDDCGAKWADDKGGKPQWDDPAEWVEARTILLGINKTAASEASQC